MSRAVDDNSPTSVEMVTEALMAGIRAGRYAPGQRLFAGEFAESLGLSRSPVREAFHLLAGQGVLDLLPNRGVEIRRLSHKHLIDMMALLRVLGEFGLECALPHLRDPEARQRVEAAVRAVEQAADNRQPYEWFQVLVSFHFVINSLGDNLYLETIWPGLHLTFFNRSLSEKLPGRHWGRYIENYRQICEAVLSDEPERAIPIFGRHMRWATGLLAELDSAPVNNEPKHAVVSTR